MNSHVSIIALAALSLVAGCGTITHTPPGTSVEVALAKKGELVRLPTPLVTPGVESTAVKVAAVEPPLPERNDVVEKVAEAYSRGVFCLEAGKEPEAIEAFEEAVKFDPTFTAAWEKLAILYEKAGDPKKSLEAFNKAKKLARQ